MSSRERAKEFDRVAEWYDRSRPSYPDELIDDVLGPAPQGLSVLDIACGTGIASRQMTARGADVLGIDLNPGMAAIAERHGIRTELGAFETWDPAGRTFDRVTCAQAWHWLDHDVSLGKAASVLRPGGRVCLFWNIGHHPEALADALAATYDRVLSTAAPTMFVGYATNRSPDAAADHHPSADLLCGCDELVDPQATSFPWTLTYTRDAWLDELQSHSDHAVLEPALREELLSEIGRTIDDCGGTFEMTYVSVLISATRR